MYCTQHYGNSSKGRYTRDTAALREFAQRTARMRCARYAVELYARLIHLLYGPLTHMLLSRVQGPIGHKYQITQYLCARRFEATHLSRSTNKVHSWHKCTKAGCIFSQCLYCSFMSRNVNFRLPLNSSHNAGHSEAKSGDNSTSASEQLPGRKYKHEPHNASQCIYTAAAIFKQQTWHFFYSKISQ